MKINQIKQLVTVNIQIFFREPGALFWSFAFPIAMAWVLGIAFSSAPEKNYTVLMLGDVPVQKVLPSASDVGGKGTYALGEGTGLTTNVSFKAVKTEDEIETLLKKGKGILYVEDSLGKVLYHYDPANAEAVNLFLLLERELRTSDQKQAIVTKKITTKGIRYIDFLIPGLLAMTVMNSCVWGISWYLIELRMKKLLRRIVATPMKKSDFIISHFITRLLLTLFESLTLIAFAWLFFDMEMTGNFMAFMALYIAGIVAFGGIGLLLGSRTQSTHVGNGLINAVVLPMTIVSGIFFSYDSFPSWIIPIIKALPLTLLADGIRSVFNEGAGISEVLLPCGILASMGTVFYLLGLKIFKWY